MGKIQRGGLFFQYERILNLCYWCGRFTHDDKECPTWLQSKGSLALEEQRFGAWLRVPQFNPSCCSYVEVKGFYALDHPWCAMVDEKGPDKGTGHSLISLVGNFDETVTKKDGTENATHDFHNQLPADFSGAIKGIEAMNQVSLFSNSKCTIGSIKVRNKEVFSMENMGN